uniref:Platelet-derived growth factor (PDGF) family profile domain-containing protein n=1 Tax=Nothobranchius furzeri TaxID=105023 RepID=A0A8C6LIA4_NOTFU
MSCRQKAPGSTQDTLERLHLQSGPGTPWGPAGGAGGGGRGEDGLELPSWDATQTLVAVGFLEVLARSSCQPMDQLVGLEQEFPWEVEYLYRPSSVLVRRCSGCCGDEGCDSPLCPQVMRILPTVAKVELVFIEHQACECRKKEQAVKTSNPACRACAALICRTVHGHSMAYRQRVKS